MINLYDITPPPMIEKKKVELDKCDCCKTQTKKIVEHK